MNDTSAHLTQLRDLAANYSDRQGLRIVPMGLSILIQFLPLPGEVFGVPTDLICLLAGIAGYPLVGLYYRRRFGHVEELPHNGMAPLAQWIVVLIPFIAALAIDVLFDPPLLLSGLVIAIWLILAAWPSRAVRTQYTVIGPALVLISLLPIAGLSHALVAHIYAGVFGVALVLAGIADHVRFLQLLPSEEVAA